MAMASGRRSAFLRQAGTKPARVPALGRNSDIFHFQYDRRVYRDSVVIANRRSISPVSRSVLKDSTDAPPIFFLLLPCAVHWAGRGMKYSKGAYAIDQ